MGSIRKAPRTAGRRGGEVRWEARYRDPTGHQRTKTFATQADAKAFLSVSEADIHKGQWIDPAGGKVLLSDWIEEWWPTVQSLRRSTRERDRGYIDRYIVPELGELPLGQITQPDIKTWAAKLSARPRYGKTDPDSAKKTMAPATVVKASQILGKVMAAAVDAGLIATSPCRNLDLPKIESEEMRFLTVEEVNRLAGAIDKRYRALVLLGCWGGLRMGELAGLRRSRLNPLKGTVEVAEIADETKGLLTYGPPKTKASRRIVAIPKFISEELTSHLTAGDNDLVFPAPDGGGLRVNSWRRRFWQPAVKAAGLAPLRPHDMRHTAVALWIAAGGPVLQVSRQAGHTSTSFTLDRYGHLFPQATDDLRTGLDRLASGLLTGAIGS